MKKILIIEDDHVLQRVLSRLLEDAGYEPVVVDAGMQTADSGAAGNAGSLAKVFAREDAADDSANDEQKSVNKRKIRLHIRDNGIGIPAQDLPGIFEKSFTGENGRQGSKSTGMGLYIAGKLCKKPGHEIHVLSVQGEYTEIILTFDVNDYYSDALVL